MPETKKKPGKLRRTARRLSILSEFWKYLKVRKKWWLGPILLLLLMLAFLIILVEGSALAPFIYTLF